MKHPALKTGQKLVVIVGGGFAGLNAAKALAGQPQVLVILIDQKNHHLFQPLLYQVATAGLNPSEIAVPIRAQFSDQENVEVHLDRVLSVDLQRKTVKSEISELDYDYLILACGAQHSYFAHPEWEPFAPGLKTLEQATEIRRRILLAFEQAENESDPEIQKRLLNFVVVGGGPTGVELAGAIAEISRTVLVSDFKNIRPENARVILVEAGPRILASFNEELSKRALRDLESIGVEVLLSSRVEHIDALGVQVGNKLIHSQSVFWAAGVQATKMQMSPEVAHDRAGRVTVNSDFSIPGFEDSFVIGDMAAFQLPSGGLMPGLAPAALQAGKHTAHNILNSIAGQPREAFVYFDKGQMATIGKNKAVAESGALKMTGIVAWFAWLFVHIFYLIGFKNRLSVMGQWAWSYLFSKRGSRLITERDWKLKP